MKKEEVAAVWESIDNLVPWDQNPRLNDHSVDKVANSIKRFGFGAPIVARREDKMVIAGHTRLKAAKQLGLDAVPVRYLDLDPADAKMLALADNKIGEIADWDNDELDRIINDLALSAEDMEDLGWNQSDLDGFFDPVFDSQEDEVIEVCDDDPISKSGEVYKLGHHTLVCGDCTNRDNWPIRDTGLALFTSPPYMATNAELSANKFMKKKYTHEEEVGFDFLSLMKNFTDIALNCCDQVFVNTQFLAANKGFLIDYLYYNRDNFCDLLMWDKGSTQPAMAANVCNSDFEVIFVLSKENNSRSIRFSDFRGTVSNIVRQPPNRSNSFSSVHSAVMSHEFCLHIIDTFCKKSDLVVDCFGGVGTTMIVCDKVGKKSWLIEKSELYCDVIRKRWYKYAKENNLDVGDGLDG